MLNKERHYEKLYEAWKDAIGERLQFSKSTAYVDNEEFRALVNEGDEIVPFLVKKLKNNEGLDFFLVDAIVEIMKLRLDESVETNYEMKRVAVLEMFESYD